MERSFVFDSSASLNDLAMTFREVIEKTKAPGRGFMANRMAGGVRFSTPSPSDDPFDQMGAPPDFEGVAEVPLTGGFSADFVRIFFSIFDQGTWRRAVVFVTGPTARRAGSKYDDALRAGFRRLDPHLEVVEV